MIDNFDIILPLLNFESDDDFYYLQILQRKKEHPELGKNSRVIKNYYINSVEYLEKRKQEIVALCDLFGARAMLRLNKRSYKKVAFKAMINMANTMSNEEYKFTRKSYDRALGQTHNDPNKTWILDFDDHEYNIGNLYEFIANLQPIGDKFVAKIASKNGFHIITKPFNKMTFHNYYPDVEIHKDNPTNLYIY